MACLCHINGAHDISKCHRNRIFFGSILVAVILYVKIVNAYGQHFLKITIYNDQISSFREIYNKSYTLAGVSFAMAHINRCEFEAIKYYIHLIVSRHILGNYWKTLSYLKI